MRILLDNCVKRQVLSRFAGHEVRHAVDVGWEELKNGELLRRANAEFDVLVTVDKNMRFQSNLRGLKLRVAVLNVRSNFIEDLVGAVDILLGAIEELPKGEFTVIETS